MSGVETLRGIGPSGENKGKTCLPCDIELNVGWLGLFGSGGPACDWNWLKLLEKDPRYHERCLALKH